MSERSLLTGREWSVGYRNEDGDLLELFYNPVLECAVQYDRLTGYFSADSLALAARGIEALIGNDGRMRLIVGLTLGPSEQEALSEGYDLREQIAARLCAIDLTPPDARAQNGLEMLAWMIAQGHLDVKVAIPVGSSGIYHEKVGIITDEAGNRIAFSGSVNETAGGWLNNRESFKVHRNWCDAREAAFVDYDVDAFDKFWDPAGNPKTIRVYEFPEAAKQKLLEFLPKDDRASPSPFLKKSAVPVPDHKLLPNEFRAVAWTFVGEAARLSNGLRAGETTSAVTPWQHQIRTYARFIREWPCRLLIADEVGLGKTVSAGLILRQAMMAGLANRTLILTPKSVQIQWQNELYEKFNLNVPIYDGASLCWKAVHGMQRPVERQVTRESWQAEPLVLTSSFLMRRSDRQRELLEALDWDLIVLDEAHHARRRGAGTLQEKGPNALLDLMRKLKDRCQSLLLLTATPMQVHPVELWDLIDLLGLPPEWRTDDHVFLKYFQLASGNPSPEEMEYLARQFRATEAGFGELTEEDTGRILTGASSLKRRKVLRALRDASSIPRKTLDPVSRREAARLLQAVTPLRFRMVRNTRELLRRYHLPIARRDPREVVVDMSPAESQLYSDVEDFISDSFKAAPPAKRSAVGFVMTVYRRRLASSFEALKRTLTGRLMRSGGISEEDISQDETTDEAMSEEDVTDLSAQALTSQMDGERERINELLRDIAKLGTDSKARKLKSELESCLSDGFDSAIVFTQYTDTMEYLRDYLADQLPSLIVASYSGKGGAWRDASRLWVPCSKEEIKRRLRDKQVQLLVGTDAAGEGLNLQSVGVVANYDLPWNPMKIEQRIGRIDRLGQSREVIRVLNFAYRDTVEQDVFFTVGTRINLFQGIVGRLQPILSRLPKRFEELALTGREFREAERARFLAEIEEQVREVQTSGFDIDAAVEDSLDAPDLPETPLTLSELDRLLNITKARPPEVDWQPLDVGSYGVGLPGGEPVRVTTDAKVFDFSGDSHQLFSPGGEVFGRFCLGTSAEVRDGPGIAWLLRRDSGGVEFVVATKFGLRRVQKLEELLNALDSVGRPTNFPFGEWPGVTVSVIA